jgi:hypothetical protein
MLEGVIPLETSPLVEWHQGELADVPSFTVLKTEIFVTRPQCVNLGARLGCLVDAMPRPLYHRVSRFWRVNKIQYN